MIHLVNILLLLKLALFFSLSFSLSFSDQLSRVVFTVQCLQNLPEFQSSEIHYSSMIAVGGENTPAEMVRAGGLRRGGAAPFSSAPNPSPDLVLAGGRRRGSGR